MILFLLGFIPGVGPFLVFAGRNPWVKRALDIAAALLVILAVVIGFAVHERHVGQARIEKAQAAVIKRADDLNAKATAQAATERQHDTATVAATQEELSHADDAAPDSRPSPARVAYLCSVLRHQGGSASKLPAECGSDRPAGAAAHH